MSTPAKPFSECDVPQHETLDPEVVHLIALENPFDPHSRHHETTDWYEGMTLSDALGPLDPELWTVTLNGGIYPTKESWETTYIRKGDCILGAPTPRGGGGGGQSNGKTAIRIVAIIAIAVAAAYTGGAAAAMFSPLIGAMVSAAVTVGGTMILNAIMPPGAMEIEESDGDRTYGIDGPKSTSNSNIPIPVVYGQHYVGGNVISLHTENHGNSQHLNMLINVGEGPIAGISDIYINEQPIEQFNKVTYWTRTGEASQEVVPNFDQIIVPHNRNIELRDYQTFSYHTTGICDRIRIDVTWPEGIGRPGSDGSWKSISALFELAIRPVGGNWGFYGDNWRYYYGFNSESTHRVLRRSYWSKPLERGAYELMFKRKSKWNPENGDSIFITDINEITNGSVQYNNTALLGFNIKLNEDLNTVPNITMLHGGKIIKTYNGSTWSSSASNNPAWIVWDILTNERYGAGLPEERLDLPSFYEWAQHCDTEGFTYNGVFGQNKKSIWDSMGPVYRSGHATPVRLGTRYSVNIEKAKPSSMLFSAGNIKTGTLGLQWLPKEDRANEIEVTFFDKEERHKQRTVSVYDQVALDAGQQRKKSQISLDGIDSEEAALREGVLAINYNRLSAMASWEAHIDAIAVTVGDVVDVQADMPQWGYGGRLEQGTTTSTLKLDIEVPFEAASSYAARVTFTESDKDVIHERNIVHPGDGNFSTVSLESDFASLPAERALWSIGKVTKVTKPFVIRSISQAPDFYRTINALEYVPEIYDNEIIGFVPSHSDLEGPIAPVTNVTIEEELDRFITGGSGIQLTIGWDHPNPDKYLRADVYYSIEGGDWDLVGSAFDTIVLHDVYIDSTYIFVIVPYGVNGEKGHFNAQPEHEHFVTGVPLGAPEAPVSFYGVALSRTIDLTWFTPSSPGPGQLFNIGYFIIYWAPHYDPIGDPVPTYADAIPVGSTRNNFFSHFDRVPDTDNYYWLVNANERDPDTYRSSPVPCTNNPVHTLEETFQTVFGRGVEDYDLSETLGSRIDLIDTSGTGLVDLNAQAQADADAAQAAADAAQAAADQAALDAAQAAADAAAAAGDAADAAQDAAQNALDISGNISGITNNATNISTNLNNITSNTNDISDLQGDVLAHETKISALEVTVNDPSAGVVANASALSLLDARVTNTEGGVTANASDISDIQAELTGIDGSAIIANAGAISALDVRVTSAEGTISSQSTRLTALESTVDDPSTGVNANATALDQLDTQVTFNVGEIQANATDISNLQVSVANNISGISGNSSAISALDARITTNEGDITAQADDITALESTVNDPSTGVDATASALSGLSTRVSTAEGTIDSHGISITSLNSQVGTNIDNISGNATAISGLDTRVTSAEGTISSQSTDISTLQSDVSGLEGDTSANSTAITNLSTRVTNSEGDITANSDNISQLQIDVSGIDGTAITANTTAISGLTTRVTTAEGNISTHSGDISALENTVNNGVTGVTANASAISTLDTRVDSNDGDISDLNGSISSHSGKITALENTVNDGLTGVLANASAVDTLDSRVDSNDQDISGINTSISSHSTKITNLENTVNHGTTGVVANASAVSTLGSRVDSNDDDIIGINQAINSNSFDITALENTVNHGTTGVVATASGLSSLTTRVGTAEGNITANADDISQIQLDISGIDGSAITANTTAISALTGRVDVAEGTISAHSGDISALESTVNNGVTGVLANASAVSTLDTRVDSNDQDISGLNTTVSSYSGKITALENTVNNGTTGVLANASAVDSLDTRVDSAEGSISSYGTKISNLESTVNNGTTGVAANASAVSSLNTRVGDNEDGISSHNSRLISLEGDVNSPTTGLQVVYDWAVLADARIGTNEDDISGNVTDISNLEATVNNGTTGVAANASAVSLLQVDVGNAQSDADGAVQTANAASQSVTQLSTTVGDNTTDIEIQGNSINGLKGQYSVKIDTGAGGHVAGFGLSNTANEFNVGEGHSEFMVLVDRFAVASPSATDLSFEIEDGEVRMDGAKIKDASINNVKIGNVIQSNSLNLSIGRGWKIDKNGRIQAGELTIYDKNGDVIIQSGTTTTVFHDSISNAKQTFADISSLPDYLDWAAFAMAPQGVYGNVWFEHDQPQTGRVKIRGTKLYLHNGQSHTIIDDQTLDTFPDSAYSGFVFFTPRNCKSEFSGWVDGTYHRSDWFFIATLNSGRNAFDVWDGAGTLIQSQWIPLKDTPVVATLKSAGAGGQLDSFNSLIGANLDLPSDGATKTGMASMLIDGGFVRFAQTGTFNLDPNWSVVNGSVSSTTKFTRKGKVPMFSGSSLNKIESQTWCEVSENTPVYAGISMYLDSTVTGGSVSLSLNFYDSDKALIGTYAHTPVFSEGYETWHLETFVDITPMYTSYVKVAFKTNDFVGGGLYVDTISCSLAPQEITQETTPTFIKSLSVDTLQVKDEAITKPIWGELTQYYSAGGTPVKILTVPFTPSAPDVPIMLTLSILNDSDYGDSGSRYSQFRRNGVLLRQNHCFYTSGGGSLKPNFGLSTMFVDRDHGGVPVFYEIWIWGNGSSFRTQWSGLQITEIKK